MENKVTLKQIHEEIVSVEVVKYETKSKQVLRWAVLTTKNGFAVVGKPSCSVSPELDNEEIGNKVAVDNSITEMWPLLGYELKTKLHNESK